MKKLTALDLFCGAGGASKGLKDAGFNRIVGIDIDFQEFYPYEFVQADVIKSDWEVFSDFDFIWASPPCQAYSAGTKGFRNKGKKYPDLVAITRKMLLKTGVPFVLENVPGAPLRKDLLLCGEMFNLPIIRHRIFEIHGFECEKIEHKKHKRTVKEGTAVCVCTAVKNPGLFGKREQYKKKYGHKWAENYKIESWQKAMQIFWVKDRKTLAQCVPPAYAEYIGRHFINGL